MSQQETNRDKYFEETVRPHSYNDIIKLAKQGKANIDIADIVSKKYALTIDYPLKQMADMVEQGVLIENCTNPAFTFGCGTTFTVTQRRPQCHNQH